MPPQEAPLPEPIRKLHDPAAPGSVPMPALPRPGLPRPHGPGGARNGPPLLPPALANGPDLPGLLKAFQRRWMLAVSVGAVLAVAVAGVVWLALAPKYTATAQVYVSSSTPKLMPDGTHDDSRGFSTYIKTQAARIKSRFVLSAALKKEAVQALAIIKEQPDPLIFLEEELTTATGENSEFITVSMIGADPAAVTTIVKAVVDAYLDEVVKVEQNRKTQRLAELDKVRAQINEKVRLKKDAFRKLADELGSIDKDAITQKHVNVLSSFNEMNKQLGQLKFDAMRAEGKLKAHKVRQPDLDKMEVPAATVDEAMAADPRVKSLTLQVNAIKSVLTEYRRSAVEPEREPTYIAAKRQLAEVEKELGVLVDQLRGDVVKVIRGRIDLDFKNTLAQLERDYEVAVGQRDTIAAEVDKVRESAEKLGGASTELEMLRADIRQEDRDLEKVNGELSALRIELNAPNRVSLAQEAGVGKKDVKRLLMALVAGPAGVFALVCAAVSWFEFRSRRIQSTDEVIVGLGMRVVGSLPALPLNAQQRVLTGDGQPLTIWENSLLESVDAVRTMLLKDASVEATRVVMVSSAVGGEGKTMLAAHLAGSLARAGRKTLLIDTDLRAPAVHQLFEQPQQPGFAEVLLGETHLIEATRSTPVDGLWLMPAGQFDREVLAALARDGLEEIFDKLKGDYDFIVVDSHPILGATDSLLVGQHADAVLLSLLRDVSQAPRVYAAYQRLGTLGIRVLGAVVHGMKQEDCMVNTCAPAAA